jgi:hypothetical protein
VFQIVMGGERLLTGRDLRYSDADIDTQPTDIVYTRRGIPNGGIYQASDPTVRNFLLHTRGNACDYVTGYDCDSMSDVTLHPYKISQTSYMFYGVLSA